VRGLTLDAGALIALERRSPVVSALLERSEARGIPVRIPAPVLAQVWRGSSPRQARLARLVKIEETAVVVFDAETAKAAGQLLAESGTSDVVDAAVVLCARVHGDRVVTSDPGDLLRLDRQLELVTL